MSSPPSINLKIDSGATHCFQDTGSTDLPKQPTYNYNTAAWVFLPKGESMVSYIITHLIITYLPPSDKKSQGFNNLASGFLFSVGQAYDHNFTAVFEKNL